MAVEPAAEETRGEFQAHARDYSGFTKMVKWGAIASFIIGAIVVLIISS